MFRISGLGFRVLGGGSGIGPHGARVICEGRDSPRGTARPAAGAFGEGSVPPSAARGRAGPDPRRAVAVSPTGVDPPPVPEAEMQVCVGSFRCGCRHARPDAPSAAVHGPAARPV